MSPKFCKYQASYILFFNPRSKILAFLASCVARMWHRTDLWPKIDQTGDLAQTLNQKKREQWGIRLVSGGSSGSSTKFPWQQWPPCRSVPSSVLRLAVAVGASPLDWFWCGFAAQPLSLPPQVQVQSFRITDDSLSCMTSFKKTPFLLKLSIITFFPNIKPYLISKRMIWGGRKKRI